MPRTRRLETGVDWIQLSTTAADWKAADPALLGTMLAQLHLIRAFEESVLELAAESLVHGPAHSSIGQEGGAVGSIVGLRSTDAVNGSHRGHHQFLAKAITHVTGGVLDPRGDLPEAVQEVLQRTLAEILGLAQGYCRGRGGSMHLQWFEAGALGTNAIVGGGAPMATGNAWAQKHSGTTDLTINYFGDGASQIGSVLESMNLAATWKLPVAYFIENNLYAVATRSDEISADPRFSIRGQGFSIPSWRVDGMDPLAVHLAMTQAAERMRSGEGPAVVEAEVYRFFHQNGPYPGSAFGYRTKEEEGQWRARDPLERVASEMQKLGLIDEAGVAGVRDQAQSAMRDAVAALVEPDPESAGRRRIRPELWPDPGFVDVGIRGDASELEALEAAEPSRHEAGWRELKFVEAVSGVMDRRMEQDERIVVLGEDVHRLGGGTNGATKGLAAKYPDRVLGTPISENAFTGLAGGMALDGRFRPVVEFMYPDFMWVAADQVFNQIGKARHMFGGDNPVPLVLRTKVAMGSGYGSQHLMDPAGIFATSPGWRIAAASTAADYVGLMNAASALQDPVLVIEHVDLYGTADRVPEGDLDYIIPPGSAAVRREGSEVTVISYLSMVTHAAEAIEQTGIDAELIDLRWLDRASLDWETIEASVKKTNAVLIVEQGAQGTSYGGWLADEIERRLFDWLDQPVQRVTGSEASPSISKVLERAAIARTEEVVAGLERVRRGMGIELMAEVVRMPAALAGVTEAAIQTWLRGVGDAVAVGDAIVEIETEKAVVEYAAETAGTLARLVASEGENLPVGTPIAVIAAEGDDDAAVEAALAAAGGASREPEAPEAPAAQTPAAQTPAAQTPAAPAPAPQPPRESEVVAPAAPGDSAADVPVTGAPGAETATAETASADGARRFASPIVRRLARERGIDLAAVAGTGPGGRIVRRDLEKAPSAPAPVPAAGAPVADAATTGGVEVVPLTGMRRAIARRLTESKTTVPHFYVTAHLRVDELLELRTRINTTAPRRISVNDLVVKAVAGALAQVPAANAVWAGDAIHRFSGVDLALAVALDDGLVTPAPRGVDRLTLSELSAAAADLAERARAGRLQQRELEGGAFSISNLGMYGVDEFSAILNPPQSGILAVGAASARPVVVDGELAVGQVMTVTLSADHRVIDGAVAAQWMAAFRARIEHPLGMLI